MKKKVLNFGENYYKFLFTNVGIINFDKLFHNFIF